MLMTALRLAAATTRGATEVLTYLGLLGLSGAAILFCLRKPTDLRWRLRLLFYPLAMNLLFFQMKSAIPKISPRLQDLALQKVDAWMLGQNLSLRLQPVVQPWLTELF